MALDELAAGGAQIVRARVVDDADVVTAGGITSGLDLALWLVERFATRQIAPAVEERLVANAAERYGDDPGCKPEKMVGAVRFELTTFCTPSRRAYQATLRPDRNSFCRVASQLQD